MSDRVRKPPAQRSLSGPSQEETKKKKTAAAKVDKTVHKPEDCPTCLESDARIYDCAHCGERRCHSCVNLPKHLTDPQQELLDSPSVRLICQKCLPDGQTTSATSVHKLQHQIAQLKESQEEMQAKIGEIADFIVPKKARSFAQAASANIPPKPRSQKDAPTSLTDAIVRATQESKEREEMTRSVVVAGLPEEEGEDTGAKIQQLLDAMDMGQHVRVEKSYRMKSKYREETLNEPSLVKVQLSSVGMKASVLSAASSLSTHEDWKKVFVRPSRPREERRRIALALARAKHLKEQDEDPSAHYTLNYGKPDFPIVRHTGTPRSKDTDWADDPDDAKAWLEAHTRSHQGFQ